MTKKRITSMGGKAAQKSPNCHQLTPEDRKWGSSNDNPKTWFYQQIVKLYLEALDVKDFKNKIERYYEARRLAKATVDGVREAMERGDSVPMAEALMDEWEETGGRDRLEDHLFPTSTKKQKTLWKSELAVNTIDGENDEPRKTILWSAPDSGANSGEAVRCISEPGTDAPTSDADAGGEDPSGD